VAVDFATRKSTALSADWRQRILGHIQSNGWTNQPIQLPSFEVKTEVLYLFTMKVNEYHVDINDHANFKFFVFGGIVCIKEAIAARMVPRFNSYASDDIIPRDLCVVFVKECVKGDDVCFKLFNSKDDTYLVGCFNDEVLLAFGEYHLVIKGVVQLQHNL
jgi:hypothetical protein